MTLQVHVLIDLEWRAQSGGQVTCWQSLTEAARHAEGLILTLHAEGAQEEVQELHPHARLMLHRPVFSTRAIPFLQTPASTDLAAYHPRLAAALEGADVIHTTDGFFAYAKTAEKVARARNIPLTHSIHTDTVAYTRIYTRAFLRKILDGAGVWLDDAFGVSERMAQRMEKRLVNHLHQCRAVLASREEDRAFAVRILGPDRAGSYRLGLDGRLFHPDKRDRNAFCARYGIPSQAVIVLFAGRLDESKNILRLIEGLERAIRSGAPLFLAAAGVGHAREAIHRRLGRHAATLGFLSSQDLAAAYASSDWLALPSKVETWSLAAAEALACGLPVIASSASGVGRFLGEEGAGLLVKEDAAPAWEAALMDACSLRDNERLRALARSAALSHFPSWEQALIEDFLPVWRKAKQGLGTRDQKTRSLY